MPLAPHLPAAPIKRLIVRKKGRMPWGEFARKLGISSRTLQRVMAMKTIGLYAADHMAIRLGTHPALVWPDWWTAIPIESCPRGGERDGEASSFEGSQAVARSG